jgi:hypothetical protein
MGEHLHALQKGWKAMLFLDQGSKGSHSTNLLHQLKIFSSVDGVISHCESEPQEMCS